MESFSFESLCSGCDALLLVEKDDLMVKIGERLNLYYTFKCPCCNIENVITSNVIPYNVRIRTLKKFRLSLKGVYVYERINV